MIFVDTGAWVAIALKNDQYHTTARRFQLELKRAAADLVTSNFVLDETYTMLLYHGGYRHAIRFRQQQMVMEAGGILSVLRITREREERSWKIFETFNRDKQWSFTDCTSRVIMEELGMMEAFAFDRHFEEMGFVRLPKTNADRD